MGDWRPQVAASILTADFGHLDRVVRKLEKAGVDRIHLDVMDGHFVPNITFGPDIAAAFRRLTALPLDVHLMISEPARYVHRFLAAEPQTVTFHIEADASDERIAETLRAIRDGGAGAGLAISPATPVQAAAPFLDWLDVIMILTVEPGFGGQRFMTDVAPKLAEAVGVFAAHGTIGTVHVDGGISRDTAAVAGAWGAEVCVVGSALFQRGRDTADEVHLVRERIWEGRRSGPLTAGPR
ncbi:MAG: ribulose-phosphate 3-epimerase [Chloroflexi bacterium]|nr:ribulose-phosphate 3-epimerase [Chloroflexota bacterium]